MLSYRHAFHAGNHADVLKHFTLIEILRHLRQKAAPFWFVDTHAGAGLYALDSGYATQLAEYRGGIGRLWDRSDLPAAFDDYLAAVRELNPDGTLRAYPGSPWIARRNLREQDRLRLFELHPTDSQLLADNFRTLGAREQRRSLVQAMDGFAGLKALLPPPPRRALVLIDPSYEEKSDYQNIPLVLADALVRFATGTFALWYPQLSRADAERLPAVLKALPAKSWLNVSLTVRTPNADGFGMHGSGMFILNPPWTLHATLGAVMPALLELLGEDAGATFLLEQRTA